MAEPVIRTGMFGVQDTPDTSGYGLLQVHRPPPIDSPRPYGSYFDTVADALAGALEGTAVPLLRRDRTGGRGPGRADLLCPPGAVA